MAGSDEYAENIASVQDLEQESFSPKHKQVRFRLGNHPTDQELASASTMAGSDEYAENIASVQDLEQESFRSESIKGMKHVPSLPGGSEEVPSSEPEASTICNTAGKNDMLLQIYIRCADKLQNVEPVVAYYCRLYAKELALKIPQRTQTMETLLISITDQLEKDRKTIELGPDNRSYLQQYALNEYTKAVDLDRVETFFDASLLFDIIGEISPELEKKRTDAISKVEKYLDRVQEALSTLRSWCHHRDIDFFPTIAEIHPKLIWCLDDSVGPKLRKDWFVSLSVVDSTMLPKLDDKLLTLTARSDLLAKYENDEMSSSDILAYLKFEEFLAEDVRLKEEYRGLQKGFRKWKSAIEKHKPSYRKEMGGEVEVSKGEPVGIKDAEKSREFLVAKDLIVRIRKWEIDREKDFHVDGVHVLPLLLEYVEQEEDSDYHPSEESELSDLERGK